MRLLLQRVTRAQVSVGGENVGQIGPGLFVLVGIGYGDTDEVAIALAGKAADLRIFRDGEGKTNRSLIDVGGEMLAISQFTLFADTRKGRRPSFLDAAPPDLGKGRARDLRSGDAGRARQRRADDDLARLSGRPAAA